MFTIDQTNDTLNDTYCSSVYNLKLICSKKKNEKNLISDPKNFRFLKSPKITPHTPSIRIYSRRLRKHLNYTICAEGITVYIYIRITMSHQIHIYPK